MLTQMTMGRYAVLVLLLIVKVLMYLAIPSTVADDLPIVFWSAEPVLPGELAMIQGAQFGTAVAIQVDTDGKKSLPTDILYSSEHSIRFAIPSECTPGVCRTTIVTPRGNLKLVINLPQPWWFQADGGAWATPGGWVRVFGRCLSFGDKKPTLELRRDNERVPIDVTAFSQWTLTGRLPKDLSPGSFQLWIHNGTGGSADEAFVGPIEVGTHPNHAGSVVIHVTHFGAKADDEIDDTDAVRTAFRAAQSHGGGTVVFPRGRFLLSGECEIPNNVRIQGVGAAFTHLVWSDSDTPPDALLSNQTGNVAIQDISIYGNNYKRGVSIAPPPSPPGERPFGISNVELRRIRLRLTPLTGRGLSREKIASRRVELDTAMACEILADGVKMIDCDFVSQGWYALFVHGNDTLCRGNTVHAHEGYGWCILGGGRRIICEDNQFTGCTTCFARCAEAWFARNKISQQYDVFREGFTLDGSFGGVGFLQDVNIDGTAVTYTAMAKRTDTESTPAAIRIVDGLGAGQYRITRELNDSDLRMERPFDPEPSQESRLWAANAMYHLLFVDNTFSDTGVGVQLYGGALDCIVAGNVSERSGGFRAWGNNLCWYVQFIDNRITEGYGVAGPEASAGSSSLNVIGPFVRDFRGTTTRGIVLRRNQIDNNGAIVLRGSIQDVLIENNVVRHSPLGVVADQFFRQDAISMIGNRFIDVDVPFSPSAALRRYHIIGGAPKGE